MRIRSKPIVVIATHNHHKLKEIKKILGPMPFTLKGLDHFPPPYKVRESGKTLEQNAIIKAKAAFKRTGHVCVSDDTGLEVLALGGKPGVYSARYAGYGCSFEDNNRKLLRKLKNVSASKRKAVFRCAVSVALPDGKISVFKGKILGHIVSDRQGNKGFGYDPVFQPKGYVKTFSEMSLLQKNTISHRYLAFKQAGDFLKKVFSDNSQILQSKN